MKVVVDSRNVEALTGAGFNYTENVFAIWRPEK